MKLSVPVNDTSIVEVIPEDGLRFGGVEAVPSLWLACVQVEETVFLVLLDDLVGGRVGKGEAALAGWDVVVSRDDESRRDRGEEKEE